MWLSKILPFLVVLCSNIAMSSSVAIIGDSIFATGNNMVRNHLESISGLKIDSHARTGAIMTQIRDQYRNIKHYEIETIVMDGGGNDILGNSGNCRHQNNDNCKSQINTIVETARLLFEEMHEDGVERVVFMTCHYPRKWNSGYVDAINYGTDLIIQACSQASIDCRIADPRKEFEGKDHYLEWDGVHPNWNGAKVMAELIWSVLNN